MNVRTFPFLSVVLAVAGTVSANPWLPVAPLPVGRNAQAERFLQVTARSTSSAGTQGAHS